MGICGTWTINLWSFLELTFAGTGVEGRLPPVRAGGSRNRLWLSGRGWLRDQKQEGEDPGAAANSRLSLSSKLFVVTFLAVLCSWVMYKAQPNLINWKMWATHRQMILPYFEMYLWNLIFSLINFFAWSFHLWAILECWAFNKHCWIDNHKIDDSSIWRKTACFKILNYKAYKNIRSIH